MIRSAFSRSAFLVAVWLAVVLPSLHAQTTVGRIASLQGDVRLDAFGKGAFIAAVQGDRLYRESVLKLAADAQASLEIGQARHVAPPGALLRVADLMGAAERRGGLRWTEALGKLISDARRALQGGQAEVALGSRAAEQGADMSVDWAVEEEESGEIYEAAMTAIGRGDTAGALEGLLTLETATTDAYSAAELDLWRGYCYFDLGAYAEAESRLQSARLEVERDPAALEPALGRLLLLELGASRFYLGRPADAVAPLRTLARARPGDDRTLYGYLFLVESLAAAGDRAGAGVELRAAEALYPSGATAAELAALRRKLAL